MRVFDGVKLPLAPSAANAPGVGTLSRCLPLRRSGGVASSSVPREAGHFLFLLLASLQRYLGLSQKLLAAATELPISPER